MRKYIYVLLVVLISCRCVNNSPKEKIYYFYDEQGFFTKFENCNDSVRYLVYATKRKVNPPDSFSISGGYKTYMLNHYYKYLNEIDTAFFKHKSYLDSVNYFGKDWFIKEENLDQFWKPFWYGGGGISDTTLIYIIEPVDNSDSLIFRRVHRVFFDSND